MSLVTTAGASDADSYVALADADAYFSARGVTTWTGADADKENALRKATSYLDNAYRDRWVGVRTNYEQALAWPRCNAETIRTFNGFTIALIDSDGFEILPTDVPLQIQRATFEAALLALTGTDLQPALLQKNIGIKSIGKGVGPLRKDITYRDDAPMVDRYLAIEGYLRGLVLNTPGASSGTVRLVRG
jgi:hypothetical protein